MMMGFGLGLTMQRPLGGGGSLPASFVRDFQPNRDEGTNGDYFVDASVASSGVGTSIATAFKTVQEAVDVWKAGKIIRVRNNGGTGIYLEEVNLLGKDGIKILGYGTEKPIISGKGPAVTGWTQCAAGDATELGSIYASVYKKTVPASTFIGSDPRCAFPFEGDLMLLPAMVWPENPAFPAVTQETAQWITSDVTNLGVGLKYDTQVTPFTVGQVVTGATSGATGTIAYLDTANIYFSVQSGTFVDNEVITDPLGGSALANGTTYQSITGYQKASVTSAYTSAQITNADVLFHRYPNLNDRTKVLSVSDSTINLTNRATQYENNSSKDKFALINVLPAMKQGEWGFVDIGGGNITIYIWPVNPANINTVTFTVRGRCIKLSEPASTAVPSKIELRGLILERTASAGVSTDHQYALCKEGDTSATDWLIENLLVRNTYRANRDYGAIRIKGVDNLTLRYITVENAVGQFAMFISGHNSGIPTYGLLVEKCHSTDIENSPYRFYGQYRAVFAFLDMQNAGLSSHANLSNVYEQCHQVLYYGCNFLGGDGFLTPQETSQFNVIGCILMAGYDGRGIVDQNNATATPARANGWSGAGLIFNNTIFPNPNAPLDTRSFTAGTDANPECTYGVFNNIFHGASGCKFAYIKAFDNNLLTIGTQPAGANNGVVSTAAAEYTDAAAGDFSFKPGAAVRSMASRNMSAEIAALQAIFTQFTGWGLDVRGQAVNWAAPKIGAVQDYDGYVTQAPVWYVLPTLTGTPIVGVPQTVNNGFVKVSPYAAPTRQWRSTIDNLRTWTNLAGSTAASYTPVSGDIGCRVAPIMTVNGKSYQVTPSIAVASSFPLTLTALTPIKQLGSTGSSAANNRETAAYTLSGAPIVVIASQRQVTAANAVVTATVGTAGRGYGTGTALLNSGISRRFSTESDIFYHLTPGSGSKTIQVQSNDNSFSYQVAVYEVAGMTGIGTISAANGSSSDTTRTTSLTTVATNSIVMHVLTRLSGDKTTNAITLSAPDTLLLMDNSGGTSTTNDITTCIAYEQAAAVGTYSATFTWPTAANVTCCAIELKS